MWNNHCTYNTIITLKLKIMNKLELEGKWNQIKGSVKQKYGEWFNDNEALADGKVDEVIGRIQEKSGKTREEVEKMIQDWKV